jgi:transposase InsO family protein
VPAVQKQHDPLRDKIDLLELARRLGNVARACELMGVSRDTYYRLRRQYDNGGAVALAPISRARPLLGNRVEPGVERAVLELALAQPTFGQARIAAELSGRGIAVSPAGVRGILVRHGLPTRRQRLRARAAPRLPGQLTAQDSLAVGHMGSLGEVWQQTLLDTATRMVFARVYPAPSPEAAADLLATRVLPFFDGQSVPLRLVVTDRSLQYCGRPERHAYRGLLASRGIAHGLAGTAEPAAALLLEDLHRLMLDEFYKVAARQRAYTSLDELQRGLDAWVDAYNRERGCDGWWCFGRSPFATFEAMRSAVPQGAA